MNPVTVLTQLIAAVEASNWGTALTLSGQLIAWIGAGITPIFGTAHKQMMATNATKTKEEVIQALKDESTQSTVDWQSVLTLILSLLKFIS